MFEILTPQVGVNDDKVILAAWHVKPGQQVAVGFEIATIETTKATFAIEAGAAGYVYPVVAERAEVPVRAVLGLIAPEPTDHAAEDYAARRAAPSQAPSVLAAGPPGSVRLTANARALAEKLGVDLASLPSGRILRERDIQRLARPTPSAVVPPDDRRRVAVYGASEGGMAAAEALRAVGDYEVVAFLDDTAGRAGQFFAGLPIWGGEVLLDLRQRGIGSVVTHIANREFRLALRGRALAAGVDLPNIVHPRAFVSPSARLGCGNLIKAGAVVETESAIGDCCIVDNLAVVPHHNTIGDGVHLAPGVALGGGCKVGDLTLIGVGACVASRISVGRNVIVRPGSVVLSDIPDDALVGGDPARAIGRKN